MVKYRNGFVSNSSSSSYIVAYLPHPSHVCECCGNLVMNLYDLIDDASWKTTHSESTQIIFSTIDAILAQSNETIKDSLNNLKRYKHYDPTEKVSSYATAGQTCQWANETIDNERNFQDKLHKFQREHPDHKIIKIQVNYDDEATNSRIKHDKNIFIFEDDY